MNKKCDGASGRNSPSSVLKHDLMLTGGEYFNLSTCSGLQVSRSAGQLPRTVASSEPDSTWSLSGEKRATCTGRWCAFSCRSTARLFV